MSVLIIEVRYLGPTCLSSDLLEFFFLCSLLLFLLKNKKKCATVAWYSAVGGVICEHITRVFRIYPYAFNAVNLRAKRKVHRGCPNLRVAPSVKADAFSSNVGCPQSSVPVREHPSLGAGLWNNRFVPWGCSGRTRPLLSSGTVLLP